MIEHGDPEFEKAYLARLDEAHALSKALEGPSLAMRLARLPEAERDAILADISPIDATRLLFEWEFWARPKQRVPEERHRTFLYLAGRGSGKSRTASERVRERIYGGAKSIALIGPRWRDVMRYMVGGKLGAKGGGSGLLDVFPPWERKNIELRETKGEIRFPEFEATAYLVSAETPEFRGANLDTVWCDEIVWWKYLQTIWDNMELSLRLDGDLELEIIVTTTPRPLRFLKELVIDPDTITVIGATDENADNLDKRFLERLEKKYGGSRLARQERYGEILNDNPDALFHQTILDATRVQAAPEHLVRVAVSIDPAISTKRENDPTGIVSGGIDERGHIYVMGDGTGKYSPEEWGSVALKAYDQVRAGAFVGERNRGGDLVASNMRATIREARGKNAVAKIVEVHATRGKEIRAEPVATLHEQGRIHIVGSLPELEQEITEWNPKLGGVSPNRLDALVWLCWYLADLGEEQRPDRREGFKGLEKANASLATRGRHDHDATWSVDGGAGWGRTL